MVKWYWHFTLAGVLSRRLCHDFIKLRIQMPKEPGYHLAGFLYKLWMDDRGEEILNKTNDQRKRLIGKLDWYAEKKNEDLNLFLVFADIMYIETGFTAMKGKVFWRNLSIFVETAKKYGFDYSKEYAEYKANLQTIMSAMKGDSKQSLKA